MNIVPVFDFGQEQAFFFRVPRAALPALRLPSCEPWRGKRADIDAGTARER